MRGGSFVQGKFNPINKRKYKGDVNNIVFRSSWELVAMRFCDETDEILAWSSEELIIPYTSPLDNKKHRYFTDLCVWCRQKDGKVRRIVIEIKPHEQTIKPVKRPSEKDQAFVERVKTYLVNQAKWKTAQMFCESEDSTFVIWTEKQLFPSQNSLKRYRQPKKK